VQGSLCSALWVRRLAICGISRTVDRGGDGDCEFERGADIALPIRHSKKPIQGLKLRPQTREGVVVVPFELRRQFSKSYVLRADLAVDHIGSVL
jgi:hypothetical protein